MIALRTVKRDLLTKKPDVTAVRNAIAGIVNLKPPPRPERLSGIHNPWGFAAPLTNAWAFLDLCEHPALVDQVAALIGPHVILWDSELYMQAGSYRQFIADNREGRYWPVTPLKGAVALVTFSEEPGFRFAPIESFTTNDFVPVDPEDGPLYVIRYMPATSRFVRDPKAPANWVAMEEQPLINYTTRPLWLVRGNDQAGNDFVTGFASQAPRWAAR